jgi:hypothetical protein
MKSRLLYRYLQRLPEAEWPDFEAFLGSPWMGKSKTYQRFLKEFHAMRFQDKGHTVESFHEAVYPGRAIKVNNLKRQLSLMQDRFFAFLA